jgi:hypothetical protein
MLLFTSLYFIVWGLVGILFSRTIHRYNRFLGVPQHIPTGRHSVVALRAVGAVFLLAGMLAFWFWFVKERSSSLGRNASCPTNYLKQQSSGKATIVRNYCSANGRF